MSRRRLPLVLAAVVLAAAASAVAPAAADTSTMSPACAELSLLSSTHDLQVKVTATVNPQKDYYIGDVVQVTFRDFQNTDSVTIGSVPVGEASTESIDWGTASAVDPTLSWTVPEGGQWAILLDVTSTDTPPTGTVHFTISCQELLLSEFEAPVDAAPVANLSQAGRTVPLRFTVTDTTGTPVTDLTTADVTPITELSAAACADTAGASAIETYSSGASTLTHLGGGRYLYSLKTDKAWRGTCGPVGVSIRGVDQTAFFRFRS